MPIKLVRTSMESRVRVVSFMLSEIAGELDDRACKHPSYLGGLARGAMRLMLFIAESIEKGDS